MEMYTYSITVKREGRKFYAYSERFPGVYGLGSSIQEAKTSILEAVRLYIEECRATLGQSPAPFPATRVAAQHKRVASFTNPL